MCEFQNLTVSFGSVKPGEDYKYKSFNVKVVMEQCNFAIKQGLLPNQVCKNAEGIEWFGKDEKYRKNHQMQLTLRSQEEWSQIVSEREHNRQDTLRQRVIDHDAANHRLYDKRRDHSPSSNQDHPASSAEASKEKEVRKSDNASSLPSSLPTRPPSADPDEASIAGGTIETHGHGQEDTSPPSFLQPAWFDHAPSPPVFGEEHVERTMEPLEPGSLELPGLLISDAVQRSTSQSGQLPSLFALDIPKPSIQGPRQD